MLYNFLQESAGRELVGAGNYSSRSSVVQKLISKYPTPQVLATDLMKLAKSTSTTNPKLAQQYFKLAEKCKSVSNAEYPSFLKEVAGLSKLWSTTAKVTGGALAAAGLTYLASVAIRSYGYDNNAMSKLDQDTQNNILNGTASGDPEEIKRQANAVLSHKGFLNRAKDTIKGDYANYIKSPIMKWRANKALAKANAEDAAALEKFSNEYGMNSSDLAKSSKQFNGTGIGKMPEDKAKFMKAMSKHGTWTPAEANKKWNELNNIKQPVSQISNDVDVQFPEDVVQNSDINYDDLLAQLKY